MELDIEIKILQNLFNEFCLHKEDYNIDFDWEIFHKEYDIKEGDFDWRACQDCGLCRIKNYKSKKFKRDYCFAIWHDRILTQLKR